MNTRPRHAADQLTRREVPTSPGVYAWYREDEPIYSGRAEGAKGLKKRVWDDHLNTRRDLTRSTFRRNVCQYLGIAPTSRTTIRPTVMTADDVRPVNRWIRECEVAWINCSTAAEATALEESLHGEWMPPLSRR
ncbi:MAG: GIY-YIG nuclease family protein [Mycobacteriaceae bacterium]